LWIYLNGYVSPWYDHFNCPIRLYPSYLVTDNTPPPFCAVHVAETKSLEGSPLFGIHLEQWQLCRDNIRLTIYGADNNLIQTFLAFIIQYSQDWNIIGLANMPVISDEKETQPELNFIAQKKRIEIDVNYQQQDIRNLTRQVIESATVQFVEMTQPY
jgi:hypothetical protein